MLIAQITDTHIMLPGALAYGRVDTAAMLGRCVAALCRREPKPDLIVLTGDLVDRGMAAEYVHLRKLLAPLSSPLVVIPGNHDDREALRAAFVDHAHLPREGFLQFTIDAPYAVRLVGLDTVVPGQGGGALCDERLAWFDLALAKHPHQPTVVLMHHPPFVTGIGHMDRLGLAGREGFARIVGRHRQVQLVLCGHLHRNIQARIGNCSVMTAPSTAHQVALDLRADAPSRFNMEPPGYLLHRWDGEGFVSHQACIEDYPGPFPFFAADGSLID